VVKEFGDLNLYTNSKLRNNNDSGILVMQPRPIDITCTPLYITLRLHFNVGSY